MTAESSGARSALDQAIIDAIDLQEPELSTAPRLTIWIPFIDGYGLRIQGSVTNHPSAGHTLIRTPPVIRITPGCRAVRTITGWYVLHSSLFSKEELGRLHAATEELYAILLRKMRVRQQMRGI